MKISELDDRDLNEAIFATQIVMLQKLSRINIFFLEKYGKEYVKHIQHKDEIYEYLESDLDDFWGQYEALIMKREKTCQ